MIMIISIVEYDSPPLTLNTLGGLLISIPVGDFNLISTKIQSECFHFWQKLTEKNEFKMLRRIVGIFGMDEMGWIS